MLLLAPTAWGRGGITVIERGEARLPVVVSADASAAEARLAAELARVLGRMTGQPWPLEVSPLPGQRGIFVGRTAPQAEPLIPARDPLAPRTGEVGPGTFRFTASPAGVYIEGVDAMATEDGVAWFLQDRGGVRWYDASADGEQVPQRQTWILEGEARVVVPGFVSREIGGLDAEEERRWARRHGLQARFDYNHALSRTFPVALLRAFPEWSPLLRDERYLPADDRDHHWQPHLALPEVAQIAGHVTLRRLAEDPERLSYSLAINDTVRFDQSTETRRLVEPLRYFRGMPDYSPLVFTFMNRAAAVVAESRTDRYLGCLAYFWCETPPPFPVHRQVLPYVTTDRAQYYDADYRDADLRLMDRWRTSGTAAFGLWEYAYGQEFLIPRLPLRALAQGVSEGAQRGARGYFADTGPQPGFDAFKIWMLARMLEDPGRDPEALADEFYPAYYGAAAEPMRRFFERCEQQWMQQPGPPYWLKYYQQEDQALLFPSEVTRELGALLRQAAERTAGGDPVSRRVALTARAFAVTDAYVAFDGWRRKLAAIESIPAFRGLAASERAEWIGEFRQRRLRLVAAFVRATEAPVALRTTTLDRFVRNDPVPALLWSLDPGEAEDLLAQLRSAGGVHEIDPAWSALLEARAGLRWDRAVRVTRNPRFADGTASHEPRFLFPRSGLLPGDWVVHATPTEGGAVGLVDRAEDEGVGRALRIEGAWDTQVFQWQRIEPGALLVASAKVVGEASPGNDSGLFLSFLDANGRPTGVHRMQTLTKGVTASERRLILGDVAPAGAAWVGVGVGASRQVSRDYLEVREVELIRMTERGDR